MCISTSQCHTLNCDHMQYSNIARFWVFDGSAQLLGSDDSGSVGPVLKSQPWFKTMGQRQGSNVISPSQVTQPSLVKTRPLSQLSGLWSRLCRVSWVGMGFYDRILGHWVAIIGAQPTGQVWVAAMMNNEDQVNNGPDSIRPSGL